MEPTRLDRIESLLEQTAALGLQNERAISKIVTMHESHQKLLDGLVKSINHYVESSDAGMKRLEENLDGLIRAITAEHTNGKAK